MGYMVLAVPYIFDQCTAMGSTLESRLPRLVTHGLVHILGYDHENEADHAVMRKKELEILEELQRQFPADPIDME
jgi:probable rRNA maturation factor